MSAIEGLDIDANPSACESSYIHIWTTYEPSRRKPYHRFDIESASAQPLQALEAFAPKLQKIQRETHVAYKEAGFVGSLLIVVLCGPLFKYTCCGPSQDLDCPPEPDWEQSLIRSVALKNAGLPRADSSGTPP